MYNAFISYKKSSSVKVKRIISFILIFYFALTLFGQQVTTQQGIAYQYNGKKTRTPLGNVTISYDANKRTTISGERDGSFSLTLVGRKMGDVPAVKNHLPRIRLLKPADDPQGGCLAAAGRSEES